MTAPAVAEVPEAELWTRFVQDQDLEARDRLALMYAPWASAVARNVHRKVWAYSIDCEDFIQNARVGLLEAMSRYDPDRGVAFQAFAKPRVRGAVFNGLKAILRDRPSPRDESRFRVRLESLEDAEDVHGNAFDAVVESIVSLGLGHLLDEIAQGSQSSAPMDGYAYAVSHQMESRISGAVERLPERLAHIVRAHYFQGLQFQEIAADLGVTKGRVSQLHKTALERLRGLVQELG